MVLWVYAFMRSLFVIFVAQLLVVIEIFNADLVAFCSNFCLFRFVGWLIVYWANSHLGPWMCWAFYTVLEFSKLQLQKILKYIFRLAFWSSNVSFVCEYGHWMYRPLIESWDTFMDVYINLIQSRTLAIRSCSFEDQNDCLLFVYPHYLSVYGFWYYKCMRYFCVFIVGVILLTR